MERTGKSSSIDAQKTPRQRQLTRQKIIIAPSIPQSICCCGMRSEPISEECFESAYHGSPQIIYMRSINTKIIAGTDKDGSNFRRTPAVSKQKCDTPPQASVGCAHGTISSSAIQTSFQMSCWCHPSPIASSPL